MRVRLIYKILSKRNNGVDYMIDYSDDSFHRLAFKRSERVKSKKWYSMDINLKHTADQVEECVNNYIKFAGV